MAMEHLSESSQVSLSRDSTSQSMKEKVEQQQRLHLDQKYPTTWEQKLRDRRKQAAELLRWKQDLDAEEEKVRQLERSALEEAWEGRGGAAEPALEGVPLGEAENNETQSDMSDYEARVRKLSDMLRRRRKEADMLKKERSRRMKDKLKLQEEALKRQLEAYEIYISQVKTEQADLEHEGTKRPTVPPKIKQPGLNAGRSPSPGPSASPVPGQSDHGQDELPSGHEGEKTLSPPASSSSSAKDTAKVSETNKDRSSETSVREPITDRKDPGPDRSRPDTGKPRDEKSAIPRSTSRDSEKSSIPRSISPGHRVMSMDDEERSMWRKVGGSQQSADGGVHVRVDEVDRSLSAMDDDLTPTHTPRIDSGSQMKEADGSSQHGQWVHQLQVLSTRQLQMMVDSFSALESSVAETADRPSSAPDSRDQLIQRFLQYTEPSRLAPVLIKLLSSRQSGEAPETTTTPLREYDPVNTSRSLSLERGANDRSTGEQLPRHTNTTLDHDELRSNVPEIQACQPDRNAPQNSPGVLPPSGQEDIITVVDWSVNQNEDSSSTSSSASDDKTTIYGSRRDNGRDENKLTTILGSGLLCKRLCSPLSLNVGTAVGFDSDSKTNDSRSSPDRSESSREFNDLESLFSEEHDCMPVFL